ncbi:MAG: winged helix-turn-helix domain-containing protein [Alphaproteobacteria bacterium]|nr:winged helix-turn-helix domain-containing protein [Alphaproteobacteria bacterium]
MIYRFGDYELDTDRFELRRAGEARKIEPQVFSLLELLVSNHARLVTKDEINLRVWGGRVVSEAVVNSRVRTARRAIGDDGKAQRLIRTVHGRGFRFVGDVTLTSAVARHPNDPPDQIVEAQGIGEAAPGSRPSIAVLPLQVLTPDPRYGALGDAVSQEVIVELSRLHWLFVIARGSSFRFREPAVDLAAAGRILGARYLLTGTIAFHDRTSIVTVELAHAPDGRVVWADRFESPVDDLLNLRLTISARIVAAVETRIQMTEAAMAARLPTENLDAWSAYHRGLWHMYRFNRHDNEIAARMFDRAITADRDFARAHAGLSFTHFQNAFVGYSTDLDGERALAKAHAEKSLALDPLDPFANLTMGRSEWLAGNIGECVPWFDRSIELSPNYAFAIYNRALLDAFLGEGAQCQDNVMKAISLSPIDPLNYAMLATRALSHLVRGDYDSAVTWADRATRAPNAHVHIFVIAGMAHELAGHRELAEQCVAHVRRTNRDYRQADFFRSFRFRDADTLATAQAALNRLGI